MELKVHLVFPGTCEQAFDLYKKVFGGEIVFKFRKGEEPDTSLPDAEKEKIGHIVLNTVKFTLSGEDAEAGSTVDVNSSKLILVFKDLKELNKVFDALSEGGTVVIPLHKEFFTESTGEVIDKFGIRWMIMMTDEGFEG